MELCNFCVEPGQGRRREESFKIRNAGRPGLGHELQFGEDRFLNIPFAHSVIEPFPPLGRGAHKAQFVETWKMGVILCPESHVVLPLAKEVVTETDPAEVFGLPATGGGESEIFRHGFAVDLEFHAVGLRGCAANQDGIGSGLGKIRPPADPLQAFPLRFHRHSVAQFDPAYVVLSLVVFRLDLNTRHGREAPESVVVEVAPRLDFPGHEALASVHEVLPPVPAQVGDDSTDALFRPDPLRRGLGLCQPVAPVPPVLAVLLQDPGAPENPGQGVVVPGGDGIEEVIVAAGAAEVETEEGLGRGGHLLIDDVHAQGVGIGAVCEPRADGEKAGSGKQIEVGLLFFAPPGGRIPRKEISGQLLEDESVEGLIGIERAHHVIAVRFSHVGTGHRGHLGLALHVAGHVEPVTSPAFPVMG